MLFDKQVLDLHNTTIDQPKGRLILQDTEQILNTTDNLPSRIEQIPHDFFQPQPIKGARAYYFHRVVSFLLVLPVMSTKALYMAFRGEWSNSHRWESKC